VFVIQGYFCGIVGESFEQLRNKCSIINNIYKYILFMTEPIYFTISEQKYTFDDENSKIAKKFNTEISKMTHRVDLLKKYASDVIVVPFSAKMGKLLIHSIKNLYEEEESFGLLKLSHIIGNIKKDINNTIYFYTKNEKGVEKIQAFITYNIQFMDDLKKQDPFIYIHTLAVNTSIPLDERRVSGSNIFTWFYKNAMRAGFVCIKILAITSSIDFWRNKSRFVYITDNMTEIKKKRLEALDELFEQRKIIQTTTGNEEELRKIERDITKIYVGDDVPMKRTKSQNSSDSPESISYSIVSPKKMIAQLDKQYPNPPRRAKSVTKKRTQQTSKSISRRRTKSFPT
jgi:hypothetical protein